MKIPKKPDWKKSGDPSLQKLKEWDAFVTDVISIGALVICIILYFLG